METIEYRTVDKSGWDRGQWDNEPDKKQWVDEETGLPCLIVRSHGTGALCGYVGVDKSHPAYRLNYNGCSVRRAARNMRLFKMRASRNMRKQERDEITSEQALKSFGKSTAHSGAKKGAGEKISSIHVHGGLTYSDFCSDAEKECEGICHNPSKGEPDKVWWFGFDCSHYGDISPKMDMDMKAILDKQTSWAGDGVYRDMAYVTAEVKDLARQLKAIA